MLDQAKDEALKIINQNNPDLKHKEDIADQIGIAAIKYAFLKSNIGSDIVFNLNDAISFNGNSGPYLQYTHARACSVLAKTDNLNTDLPFPIKLNPQEIAILRSFQRFPEVVNSTAINHAPHQLCTYLYDLAGAFNTFYSSHSILGSRTHPIDPVIRQLRLAITAATAQVLKNGLYLLGIPAPEKM